jgi:5S rRNA maturation endonuclease (ribonuclease M5)
MLVSKEVEMRWNSKNKKRYIDFGYTYTKMKDIFNVKVEHLPNGSIVYVECKCDYCGERVDKTYTEYLKQHIIINKDCCNNNICRVKKQEESVMDKYGESNISKTEHFKEKYKQVMMENYGVDNYFRIYDTKMENNQWFKDTNATCEQCGNIFHRKESHINRVSNNFCNIGCYTIYQTTDYEASEYKYPRSTAKYKQWKSNVIFRDGFKCIICDAEEDLEIHHLDSMHLDISKTFDVKNGITLCKKHHNSTINGSFHNLFGTHKISKLHFEKYLESFGMKLDIE